MTDIIIIIKTVFTNFVFHSVITYLNCDTGVLLYYITVVKVSKWVKMVCSNFEK